MASRTSLKHYLPDGSAFFLLTSSMIANEPTLIAISQRRVCHRSGTNLRFSGKITDGKLGVVGRHRHQTRRKYVNKKLAGLGIHDVANVTGQLPPIRASKLAATKFAATPGIGLDFEATCAYIFRSLK